MYPYTKTLSVSNDNINISTEATTIPTSTSQFASKYLFDSTIQAMFNLPKEQSAKINNHQVFIKTHWTR